MPPVNASAIIPESSGQLCSLLSRALYANSTEPYVPKDASFLCISQLYFREQE